MKTICDRCSHTLEKPRQSETKTAVCQKCQKFAAKKKAKQRYMDMIETINLANS